MLILRYWGRSDAFARDDETEDTDDDDDDDDDDEEEETQEASNSFDPDANAVGEAPSEPAMGEP